MTLKQTALAAVPFLLTVIGAFALYIFSRNRGIRPFSICHGLNIAINKDTKPRVILIDAVFTSIFGAFIGYVATQPVTYPQALAAGFGFVGIINTLGGKNE